MPFTIKNENDLIRLKNRWYLEEVDGEEFLTLLERDRYDLIGKEIKLRSPIMCADEDGCCLTCYG